MYGGKNGPYFGRKEVIKIKKIIFLLFLFVLIVPNVLAEEAQDITSDSTIMVDNINYHYLTDQSYLTKVDILVNKEISITANESVSGLYIIYYDQAIKGKLTINNKEISIGQNNYLHEYIDLSKYQNNTISIKYEADVKIADIYVLSEGSLPEWVQNWQQAKDIDLLLFSTHADDEHLFFAGLLPTYIDRQKEVLVAYLVSHNDDNRRLHERLNGLWTVGVTNYPVIGDFKDAYSTTVEAALSNLLPLTIDDVIRYQVNIIRTYHPKVIVTHDEKGEYSHGQHQLVSLAMKTAIEKARDEKYLVNDLKPFAISKLYFHLYGENIITLDYDQPLKAYANKTAFQVSKEGYKKHLSQQGTWFTNWLNRYEKASEITKYSPTSFGLYYTAVGPDINKNDVMENIKDSKIETVIKKVSYKIKTNTQAINSKYLLTIFGILLMIIFFNKFLTGKKKKYLKHKKR